MSAATEFRVIPSAPSHAISRTGEIIRLVNPAPGGDGAINQFRSGYRSPPRGSHAYITQAGKVTNRTRRQLVLEAFGKTWEKRFCRGERVKQSKLTADQVLEIRRRKATGESDASIAADFGVSRTNVWFVVHKTWTHL